MSADQLTERIARIKLKIEQAARVDTDREVFGSDSHNYEFNPPASTEEIACFEQYHNVTLPVEYKAFITTLGNGGPGDYGGAGPFYGIYPLGDFGYLGHAAKYMSAACVVDSALTEKKWQAMTAFEDQLDRESPEYNDHYERLFSGLMFIGTQGCNFQTMLILNGRDAGRVVYIDQDLQPPIIQPSFLEWYEHWLDGILNKA